MFVSCCFFAAEARETQPSEHGRLMFSCEPRGNLAVPTAVGHCWNALVIKSSSRVRSEAWRESRCLANSSEDVRYLEKAGKRAKAKARLRGNGREVHHVARREDQGEVTRLASRALGCSQRHQVAVLSEPFLVHACSSPPCDNNQLVSRHVNPNFLCVFLPPSLLGHGRP